jgi:hypothetical protein
MDRSSVPLGLNTVRVTAGDRGGQPLENVTAALLRLTSADAGGAPVVVTLDRQAPGTFSKTAPLLGLPGGWLARLVVQRSEAYDPHDRLERLVQEPSGHAAHAVRPAPSTGRSDSRRPGSRQPPPCSPFGAAAQSGGPRGVRGPGSREAVEPRHAQGGHRKLRVS